MITFLRFVGVLNASVWFGGAVFFTLTAGPAVFSPDMLNNFGGVQHPLSRFYAGLVAQVLIDRYFSLQLWCTGIAILHLLAEWLYTGRAARSLVIYLLGFVLVVGIFSSFYLQPKLKELHLTKYSSQAALEVREEATQSFRLWHGVSQTLNLIVLAGLGFYLWHVVNPSDGVRFTGMKHFRG